ncbi:hypothetical protein H634G_10313 [Metarhizium anisopliae BRIP 53293]|uniref:Uncharacterized protein n=1 Tax=Metarhizium anisopliae BRIP 53293 TaxID=1291518 RepID=A0A0D9NKJ2_METAN|nr:hypothetical protein H634G_10313 [Metarhizium anisopliae BRIP 53293]KJK87743.1 hypothetical protein H633G_08406 [Metarhizium anisopliae BRIP 53284]
MSNQSTSSLAVEAGSSADTPRSYTQPPHASGRGASAGSPPTLQGRLQQLPSSPQTMLCQYVYETGAGRVPVTERLQQ